LLFKLRSNFYAKYLLTIFSIVGGYLVLVAVDNFLNHNHTTLCIFKLTTGIPCPGCGMGRATLELMKGNIVSSFDYNILCVPFTLIILISLLWLLTDIIKKQETFFKFIGQQLNLKYKFILFGLILVDWTINIIREI
jgi:hypothetical protein